MLEHEIIKIVAESLAFTPEQIRSRSRKPDLVDARHLSAFFLRNYLKLRPVDIAVLIKRHSTTVYNCLRKARDWNNSHNPEFKLKFDNAHTAI